ncbi:peroxiredoxin-2-like isoform X1 [Coccinella septempunctata]|uniref:peroxiredoxin-2-like isoform X1 n=1 Tax=Coccinella septempunctata TaxID=41139 RepID=UPI001D0857BF|nr:peroxiredoxin-2-like isoform X1 [Coccinella septempunctata]
MSGIFNKLSRTVLRASSNITKVQNSVVSFSLVILILASTAYAPRVQQPAPNFKGTAVVGETFKEIQLSDFKGKYVVLVFYPLDFTFVCPTELRALQEKYDQFKKLNAEVIGCSIDSHYSHLGWIKTPPKEGGLGPISYPLLSDINKTIARDYDVLLEKEGIALRGTFIIDPNGILRQMAVNDLPIGRSIDEALRIIEAIRFHDEHGEVCPANWQKGGKTIKPDPQGSKEYFKST